MYSDSLLSAESCYIIVSLYSSMATEGTTYAKRFVFYLQELLLQKDFFFPSSVSTSKRPNVTKSERPNVRTSEQSLNVRSPEGPNFQTFANVRKRPRNSMSEVANRKNGDSKGFLDSDLSSWIQSFCKSSASTHRRIDVHVMTFTCWQR